MTLHPKEIKNNNMKLGMQGAIAGCDPFSIHTFDGAHEIKDIKTCGERFLKGVILKALGSASQVGNSSHREVCPQTTDIKLMLILSILSFNH